MGGKTRVFGKNRFFSTKPGFPGRTSVLLANPGYFKGLEAQGIYIYNVNMTLIKGIAIKKFSGAPNTTKSIRPKSPSIVCQGSQ